jgi:hypothetical protein
MQDASKGAAGQLHAMSGCPPRCTCNCSAAAPQQSERYAGHLPLTQRAAEQSKVQNEAQPTSTSFSGSAPAQSGRPNAAADAASTLQLR